MRRETCHGTPFVPPCAACGGSGISSCCEGAVGGPAETTNGGIDRKVQHVLMARQTRAHNCHWPECQRAAKPAMWECREHWFRLPQQLRNRIWQLYRPGQEEDRRPSAEYIAVAREVLNWIAADGGRRLL